MRASSTVPAMTTPPEEHAPAWPTRPAQPPRRGRASLVAAAAAGVVLLMAATGAGVWYFARPTEASPATSPSTSSTALTAAIGSVILQRGQFVWQSSDMSCGGLGGFTDIHEGTQVTVTDAAGKVLAVGALEHGSPGGLTTEGGMDRASTCTLPFTVAGLPAGVGPYGVEVAHRGVMRYDENRLSAVLLGF
jgi:hypothetical protein